MRVLEWIFSKFGDMLSTSNEVWETHIGFKMTYKLSYKKVCLEMNYEIIVDINFFTRPDAQFVQLVSMICNIKRID